MLYDASERPVTAPEPAPGTAMISICRSFSMKLNLGNYESADFFASQRAECPAECAEEVSRDLDQFCMDEVAESIRTFKERRRRKEAEREQGRSAA
jgi:hypothetical protein